MDQGISDEELMLRYRDGDAMAFETLYTRHKGGIYRFLLFKCRNESLAEELFQDVWMKLITARHRYQVRARFRTYLYQLANNRFIDHYRKQKPGEQFTMIDIDELGDKIMSQKKDQPEQIILSMEDTNTFLKVLNALPDEQREVFILKEESGLSISEIAEVVGIKEETAKSRLRYAVNKLRAGCNRDE